MARVRPLIVARNIAGRAVPDAEIYIYERDDTEDVEDHSKTEITLYTTEAGGTTIVQPLLTDSRGIVEEFWMAPQSYDRRIVSTQDNYIIHDEALSAQDLGGRELGYAEITSSSTRTGAGVGDGSVPLYLTGVSVPGLRPVRLIFDASTVTNDTSTGVSVVSLWRKLSGGAWTAVGTVSATASGAGAREQAHRELRLWLDPGNYDFRIQLQVANGAHTMTLVADAGVAFGPASLSVIEA